MILAPLSLLKYLSELCEINSCQKSTDFCCNNRIIFLQIHSNNEVARRREAALREHSFFQLKVNLRRGLRLTAMDKNGKF